jgi:hypothetical protein
MAEQRFQPYYFTSYDRVVSTARDVRDLDIEIKKLSRADRACLEYHLSSGNIVHWLEYANDFELAKSLKGIADADDAIRIVERCMARSVMFHRMRRGRMR